MENRDGAGCGLFDTGSAAGEATEDASRKHSRSHCTAKPQGALVLALAILGVVEQAAASVGLSWWTPGDHSFDCQMARVCARLHDLWQ